MSEDGDDDSSPFIPTERPIHRGRQTGGDNLGKKAVVATVAIAGGAALVHKGCEFVNGINEGGIGAYFQEAQDLAKNGNDAGRKIKSPDDKPFDRFKLNKPDDSIER